MDFQNYIKTELFILIPVLYIIGIGLKKSKLPNKWIPSVLGITGIALSSVWIMATGDFAGMKDIASAIFTAVTQGVLVAGASVYANQLYVQSKKEE